MERPVTTHTHTHTHRFSFLSFYLGHQKEDSFVLLIPGLAYNNNFLVSFPFFRCCSKRWAPSVTRHVHTLYI